jgi:rRNA-processing protein FCF1
MKILFDTSFLVSAMKFKIDIIPELMKFGKPEMFVLDMVVRELAELAKGRGKDGINSRLSIGFIEREHVGVMKTHPGYTDRKIITYALNRDMAVCTVDGSLKKMLLKRGAKVIIIMQGKYLTLAPNFQKRRG